MKKILLSFLLISIVSGCSVINSNFTKEYPPLSRNETVIIFDNSDELPPNAEKIGRLKATKNVHPIQTLINFEKEARQNGGHIIKFTNDEPIYRTNAEDLAVDVYHVSEFENQSIDIDSLKKHWKDNGNNQVEGIYEFYTDNSEMEAQFAIYEDSNGDYQVTYIKGFDDGYYEKIWNKNDVKGHLRKTVNDNLFRAFWYEDNKSVHESMIIKFDYGVVRAVSEKYSESMIKIFPDSTERILDVNSGTGFALSESGLIATVYHGVEDAGEIYIRGINGDFSKQLPAEIVEVDIDNDLAILQLKDKDIKILNIPYSRSKLNSQVGDNVFVLGYPMNIVMGDDIKLTNGIISSNSGYLGDATSYQVTAAVQPGSSGSPLFDQNGDLMGIVNSKMYFADNATYAVKLNHLNNLLEKKNISDNLPDNSKLTSLKLADKVNSLENFIYIIDVKEEDDDTDN